MKGKLIVAFMVLISGIMAFGMAAGLSGLAGGPGGAMAMAGREDGRGCRPDAGSSVAYPESGRIELGRLESLQAGESSTASASARGGPGSISFTNEDATPASAMLLDEDGRPAAKAFVRPGQSAVLQVPSGAYDVMVESGRDWTGQAFGACSRRLKAKGIAVVEPSTASHVVLFGDLAFVLANRMDPVLGKRLVEEDARRMRERSEANGPSFERPGREDRPGG